MGKDPPEHFLKNPLQGFTCGWVCLQWLSCRMLRGKACEAAEGAASTAAVTAACAQHTHISRSFSGSTSDSFKLASVLRSRPDAAFAPCTTENRHTMSIKHTGYATSVLPVVQNELKD